METPRPRDLTPRVAHTPTEARAGSHAATPRIRPPAGRGRAPGRAPEPAPGGDVPWAGLPVAVVVGVVMTWEGLARAGLLPPALFSSPTEVVATGSIRSGEMPGHVAATLGCMIPGLLLGAIPGLGLGLAMGWSATLRKAVDPLLWRCTPSPRSPSSPSS